MLKLHILSLQDNFFFCTGTHLPTLMAGTRVSWSSTASTLVATGPLRDLNRPSMFPPPSWRATVSPTRWSYLSRTRSNATGRRTGAAAPSSSSLSPSSTGQSRFSWPRLLEERQVGHQLETETTYQPSIWANQKVAWTNCNNKSNFSTNCLIERWSAFNFEGAYFW